MRDPIFYRLVRKLWIMLNIILSIYSLPKVACIHWRHFPSTQGTTTALHCPATELRWHFSGRHSSTSWRRSTQYHEHLLATIRLEFGQRLARQRFLNNYDYNNNFSFHPLHRNGFRASRGCFCSVNIRKALNSCHVELFNSIVFIQRFTHLQHVPFTITMQVNNDSGAQRLGMVRIFMAPKLDERGSGFLLKDQRLLMIELDKFVTACKWWHCITMRLCWRLLILIVRPGQNILKRRSIESTVTIPYDRTFRNLDSRPAGGAGEDSFNFCGCGWWEDFFRENELFFIENFFSSQAKSHGENFFCAEIFSLDIF